MDNRSLMKLLNKIDKAKKLAEKHQEIAEKLLDTKDNSYEEV